MSSRKEEERNEKIIRGLMKLPPNRRCINCNSLGPQYVCTNFWTFVCITCSGIHREFTHRVKSVSMAKFTSQEVEALQNGGNQRAREIFLKDWDPQRQRLPNSSNTDKVREFIKNVYVDRRYAGGKTSDKPPRDMQNLRHHEEETRRASSYHSYSQSPPYDYQYEERRYGKHGPALTRKPGSDRGVYEGRISTFSSPSRFSDQMNEDMFANEGSNPRASDYSVSSAGDPFRSDTQSPNFQRDVGFGSPPYQTSRNILNEHLHHTLSEPNAKTKVGMINHPQRTTSGSFESFDNHSMSVKSVNSVDAVSQPEPSTGTNQEKEYAIPVSGDFGGLDLFKGPFVPQTASSASAVDLFQLPGAPTTPSVDFFQSSSISMVPTLHGQETSQTIPSSLDLFSEMPLQQPDTTLGQNSLDDVISRNEGWATFDLPQHLSPTLGFEDSMPALVPTTDGDPLRKIDPFLMASTNLHWPAFEDVNANALSSTSNIWKEGLSNVEVSSNATSSQSWNAFEDLTGQLPLGSIQQSNEEFSKHAPSTTLNQYLGDFNVDVIQRSALDNVPPGPSIPLNVNGSSHPPSSIPSRVEACFHMTENKSTNPFDLPYSSDFETSSMFLDMSSLQAALPCEIPNSLLDGVTHPWFPPNPTTPYDPAAQQGALGGMGGQGPSSQIPNASTQGSVASFGGNPFA